MGAVSRVVHDFSKPEMFSDEQLKHLALVAHHCYNSYDLTIRCMVYLEQRGKLPDGSQGRYLQGVQQTRQ